MDRTGNVQKRAKAKEARAGSKEGYLYEALFFHTMYPDLSVLQLCMTSCLCDSCQTSETPG